MPLRIKRRATRNPLEGLFSELYRELRGQELLTLKGHTSTVLSVSLSGDGKRIASASIDRTVKVWDAQTGQEALTQIGRASWRERV